MQDYNAYVTAVNKIFDYIAKMKAGWNGQDNLNYIESIEEYKTSVIGNADIFKTPAAPVQTAESTAQQVPQEKLEDDNAQAPAEQAPATEQPQQLEQEQVPAAEQPQQLEQAVAPEVAVTPENLSQNVEALGND